MNLSSDPSQHQPTTNVNETSEPDVFLNHDSFDFKQLGIDNSPEGQLVFRSIQKAWLEQCAGSPPVAPIGEVTLDSICTASREYGIFSLDETEVTPERWNLAGTLACKLTQNPTRTMNISSLTEKNIVSTAALGVTEIPLPKDIQRASDKVAFTFGLPYIFNDLFVPIDQPLAINETAVMVLDGTEILARSDLKTCFVDAGLVYKDFNPLSTIINSLNLKHPDLHPRPHELFYAFVMGDPDRKEHFHRLMNQILPRYSLSPDMIEGYLTQFLAHSFPFFDSDIKMAEQWKGPRSPEGNVENCIPTESVKTVIISDDAYPYAVDKAKGTAIHVVDAGPSVDVTNKHMKIIKNVHLLKSYIEVTESSEADSYVKFLMNGTVNSHHSRGE